MRLDVIQQRLEDLQARILSTEDPIELSLLLVYELRPFIRDHDGLNQFYEGRAHFFRDLAVNPEFTALFHHLCEAMARIHRLIEPEKLKETPKIRFYRKHVLDYEALPLRQMHALLLSRDDWIAPGEKVLPLDADDSATFPWRHALNQHAALRMFLQIAWNECGAFRRGGSVEIGTATSYTYQIEDLIKSPWYRFHIRDFEQLEIALCLHGLPYIGTAADVRQIQRHADRVCCDLIDWLDEQQSHETKATRAGRRPAVHYVNKTFSYKGATHKPPLRAHYLVLCDVFYPLCPKVGRVPWQEVRDRMRQAAPHLPTLDQVKIRELIRSLNRWAGNPRQSLGELLDLKEGWIVRLK
jgi:hypothetical protein